ncbi:S1C family serine protease [Candidatus Rhabdochlamydia porcellionis]|uniref:Serine protease HtrA n=1 Tax=Candidatus Rhabdochlamydia porcellionis TaxID=225148 RepID=A0ABX8Z1U6_9BACT|nr:trypsin-like peptidase domain-containing protein [Candidatus Rhabdochlamydia porcellionis]QZA58532.1 Putative serine protease HtrA [Candidatus Rhabdochlamydia porcellionis]
MQAFFFLILSIFCLNNCYAAYPFSSKPHKISDTKKVANFFTEIVNASVPAVVFIQVKLTPSSSWIRSLWGNNEEKAYIGSGFLITEDGYIITNEHVIKDAGVITVTLSNQLQFDGIVVGSDPVSDIALIKIEAEGLHFLALADSDSIELGEWVAAIGSPFGLQSTVTFGIVSSIKKDKFQEPDTLQVNLSINPGNSGGPLLNLDGEVIGVNRSTWRYKEGFYTGLSFAIPSNVVKETIEKLLDQELL